MSDSSDNHPGLAADIISYIGIPLAVLGVIPIFYTSINSLVTAYNVRRFLRRNAITHAATRSSMLSGIIEVEYPIFTLTPLDRDDPDYWSLNPHPSRLKGGSWSIFNWNRLKTGKCSYRMQYSAEIKEPQAIVSLDELLSFLIDRGAVPDAKGFRLLNMTGLWTPANTSILLSPDRKESVLRITFPDDSDGTLSLALQWLPAWGADQGDSFPPHWMRVRDHTPLKTNNEAVEDASESKSGSRPEGVDSKDEKSALPSVAIEKVASTEPASRAVCIHLGMKGGKPMIDAVVGDEGSISGRLARVSHSPGLKLPHLHTEKVLAWLPVLCTALGSLTGYSLWTVHIPSELAGLAERAALPCGVLVMTQVLNDDEVPSWATPTDPSAEARRAHDGFMQRMSAQAVERTLPPAQRQAAEQMRMAAERKEMMDRVHRDRERRQLREREAIESAAMNTDVAAKGVLRLLNARDGTATGGEEHHGGIEGGIPKTGPWTDVLTAADTVLHRMIVEEKTAQNVCAVLDRWKSWVNRGGMNKDDLEFVMEENGTWFCYSIILMAVLKTEGTNDSSLALDLQECVRTWKRVRLG